MSLLAIPMQVSAAPSEDIAVSEDSVSLKGSSIPTAFFNKETSNCVLNANTSTYSQYILADSDDTIELYLTTNPQSPDFVLQVEAIDYRTNKVVDSVMLMMFQQDTVNYYAYTFKKDTSAGHCYFRFSNLSGTKGTFKYQLW
jgi:hypothetical protein